MTSRRRFLEGAALGAVMAAAVPSVLAASNSTKPASRAGVLPQQPETAGGKWRPPFRLGQGGAPLGGSSGLEMSDSEALATLESAWAAGMRVYDTSPWYGLGLSERRFGMALHRMPRDAYILSSKVGRLLSPAAKPPQTAWANADSFDYTYDYSASAARRSVEDSLQRLGVSSLDVVYIHDLSPDNGDMKDDWESYLQQAIKGAMPELSKMREEGLIKAWGMGVNTLPPILRANEAADPDIHLAACQYTLMDHQEAIDQLFPSCDQQGISIMVGSPLNNGFLAGRDRYNYQGKIPPGFVQKRSAMQRVATQYDIDLRTAALQFCAAAATVSCVIPGARQAHQPAENVRSMGISIPADFWAELKSEGLIAQAAAVPS